MTKKKPVRKKKPVKKKTRKRKVTPRQKAAIARRNGKKGGRPLRELDGKDLKFLEAMCAAGALKEDICEALAMDRNTLDAICKRQFDVGFSAYRKQKRGKGRAALAAKQLELALSGNATMLIWLGKQWLDQKEPPKEHGGPGGGPIELKHRHGLTDKAVDDFKRKVLGVDG